MLFLIGGGSTVVNLGSVLNVNDERGALGENTATEAITCSHYGSYDLVKNGFAPNSGKQKCFCYACGRRSLADRSPNGYTQQECKEEILRTYQER